MATKKSTTVKDKPKVAKLKTVKPAKVETTVVEEKKVVEPEVKPTVIDVRKGLNTEEKTAETIPASEVVFVTDPEEIKKVDELFKGEPVKIEGTLSSSNTIANYNVTRSENKIVGQPAVDWRHPLDKTLDKPSYQANEARVVELPKKFGELVIQEIMVQKNVDRATALEILENPSK